MLADELRNRGAYVLLVTIPESDGANVAVL